MSLTSDEVNILIYRYLEESGFAHTAFSFVAESQITKSPLAKLNLPPGALLNFLQKGLQYTEIEAHLNEDGSTVPFDGEFSLLTPYLPKGGLTAQTPLPSTKRKFGGRSTKKGGRRDANGEAAFDPSVSEVAVLPLTGHEGPVYHCVWNPKHSIIASGSEDATVRIWSLASITKQKVRLSRHLGGQVSGSAISLDHHPKSAATGEPLKGVTASVTVIDWSPDGSSLATGCTEGPVRIWKLQEDGVSMKFGLGLPREAAPIVALRWSPDGAFIAGGSDGEGGLTVWDANTGEVVQQYRAHKRMVSDLSWMNLPTTESAVADRKAEHRLATCSAENIIHIFGLSSPEPLHTLTGHTGEINSLQWSPEGSRLLSASDDHTSRVWNLSGLLKASASDNSAEEAQPDSAIVLEGHRKEVFSARWSPRRQVHESASSTSTPAVVVATASFDSAIKLWDPATGHCLRTLTRHSSHVYSVAFSPNGRYLASGSYDSELLVWDVATGAVLLSYVHSGAAASGTPGIFDVRWNSAGDKVAASFADKTICVLDFDGHSESTKEIKNGDDEDDATVKRSRK